VLDVGANYWSVWNWHNEAAKNVLSYYEKYPEPIDYIARHIGYRASFVHLELCARGQARIGNRLGK
jgi:hypothetical protein